MEQGTDLEMRKDYLPPRTWTQAQVEEAWKDNALVLGRSRDAAGVPLNKCKELFGAAVVWEVLYDMGNWNSTDGVVWLIHAGFVEAARRCNIAISTQEYPWEKVAQDLEKGGFFINFEKLDKIKAMMG